MKVLLAVAMLASYQVSQAQDPTLTTSNGEVKFTASDVEFDVPSGSFKISDLVSQMSSNTDTGVALASTIQSSVQSVSGTIAESELRTSELLQTQTRAITASLDDLNQSMVDLQNDIATDVQARLNEMSNSVSRKAELVGFASALPGSSCLDIKESNPHFILRDGEYYVQYAGDNSPRQVNCTGMQTDSPVNLGGDGSTAATAAHSCSAILYIYNRPAGQYWINPVSPALTDCTRQAPDSAVLTFAYPPRQAEGIANTYGYIKNATVPAGSVSWLNVDCRLPNGQYGAASGCFAPGDLVMVHQSQLYDNVNNAGTYEWNAVEAVVGRLVKLKFPTSALFRSNRVSPRQSRVAQLIKSITGSTVAVEDGKALAPAPWDGKTGGFVVVYGGTISVSGTIEASCTGFRGGAMQGGSGGCQSHRSAGYQGESWTGTGVKDNVGAGFSCCRGAVNPSQVPYRGRGRANGGGGGGGSGACHGGGGAGGSYGTYSSTRCRRGCATRGSPGDGSPECGRAGSWAQRGQAYGNVANLTRIYHGSGGGAGNSYSPHNSQTNKGGVGGGVVLLHALDHVEIEGIIKSNGCDGYPVRGTGLYTWWTRSNSQDGSGGSGSGGAVLIKNVNPDGVARIGTNKIQVNGGVCGAKTGWNAYGGWHQMGGPGGFGRAHVSAAEIVGTAPQLTRSGV